MASTRRRLSPCERELVEIQIRNIQPQLLGSMPANLFNSIASQYQADGRLSDKQLLVLKDLKMRSDLAKRSRAIQSGRLTLQNDNIDAKLDTVFNKIGR